MPRKKKNNTGIPDFEIDSLARAFIPAILDFYRTEEGQREFAEWQEKRKQTQLNKKKNSIDKSLWSHRDNSLK